MIEIFTMTDSDKSLEDFFAKKSKKKGGKGKGKKFTTSDEIAKKLVEQPGAQESVEKTETTTKKSKEPGQIQDDNESKMNYRFQDDDEWTDFRDESQKDYTGLKIQALQITEEQPESEEEEEVDENGEPIKKKEQGPAGPWNRLQDAPPAQVEGTPQPPPEPPKEEPKPATTSGKYVPPGRRAAAVAAAAAPPSSGPWARKGKAPQINSEFEFPSLAASSDLVKHSNKVEDATFSTVTKGGQAVDSSATRGGDLALENRWAALEK